MIVRLPDNLQALALPKHQGINSAWDYLRSRAGMDWLRRQFAWLSSPVPTYKRGMGRAMRNVPRIGNIRNNAALAYILFPKGLFLIRYQSNVKRESHWGMGGKLARQYDTPCPSEVCLAVCRYNVRQNEWGKDILREINYKIYVDL